MSGAGTMYRTLADVATAKLERLAKLERHSEARTTQRSSNVTRDAMPGVPVCRRACAPA